MDVVDAVNRSARINVIAIDLTPVLPGGDNGGARIFARQLIESLSRLNPRTHFVLLTSAASHNDLALLDRANVRRLCVRGQLSGGSEKPSFWPTLGKRVLAALPAVPRRSMARVRLGLARVFNRICLLTPDRQFDAELMFSPFGSTTLAEPAVPSVVTLHDLQYLAYPQFFEPEDSAHRDSVFRHACRDATKVIAISDFARRSALATGCIDPERIVTVHHRLASRLDARTNAEGIAHVHSLTGGRPYLLYPSNFWLHKNHEMLFAAWGMAASTGLPDELVLVCTGAPDARMEELENAALCMGLNDRICMPGYVPDTVLSVLMRNATALIFPSLYEGFGLPVLEAMALGIPVACSNRAALPEVAGDAALLFDPRVPMDIARAILAISVNEAERSRLVAAGLAHVSPYRDGDRMAREYWEVFQEAVGERSRSTRVSGVFKDGWLSQSLMVEMNLSATEADAELLLDVEAPSWLLSNTVKVRGNLNRRRVVKADIKKGTRRELSMKVRPGTLRVTINPGFVPSDDGVSTDSRVLTLRLHRCELQGKGWTLPLWPEDGL